METAPTHSQPWHLNVMSGADRGPVAAALRAGLAIVEPLYSAAVKLRNRRFDRPGRASRLPRPVISVGNITAGGTGKTPVVRWLAEQLRARGRNVVILSRGYKAAPGSLGDEQRMLDRLLNHADAVEESIIGYEYPNPLPESPRTFGSPTKHGSHSPSPGTPGEGRGEGLSQFAPGPHPNPLPEYRARGPEAISAELHLSEQYREREMNQRKVRRSASIHSPVLLYAHPDRLAAGERALREHPETDVLPAR